MKKLFNKLFDNKDKYDKFFELYQTQNINVKDLENKYNDTLELQYAQNEKIVKLTNMIHHMDKSLPRFAKSIQNLELLFNPSDINNMYYDKSGTLNYLMEYLNNKTKK